MTRRPLAALAVALCVALPALFAADAPVRGQEVAVPELIDQAAAYYGVNAGRMRRVAWCESRWFSGAYNPRSGASGVFQWLPSSWRAAAPAAGFAGASVFDPVANVYTAAHWMSRGYWSWWVCR